MVLVVEVWVNQSPGCECGRADPTTYQLWGGISVEVIPHSPSLSSPPAAREAVYRIMSLGGLALPPTSCSTQESQPCASARQHGGAGGSGRPTPK